MDLMYILASVRMAKLCAGREKTAIMTADTPSGQNGADAQSPVVVESRQEAGLYMDILGIFFFQQF